jgi:DNA uptake protein ComE-like DNA-binding protein
MMADARATEEMARAAAQGRAAGKAAGGREATMRTGNTTRRGSVLLLVLVVVALLTLGTATYLELMQSERRAVRHFGRGTQALRLAESGAEYVKTVLALTPTEIQQAGGLASNPSTMQAVIVDDRTDPFDRGRFTIVSPAQSDGLYAGIRNGLENESAKLNINTLLAPGAEDRAAMRLLSLPGMTPEVADAILDWLDQDGEPRENGAEEEVYSQLTPQYAPRNGPIPDLDELLLVRGVTPELLYGLDQNRNFFVEATETPRGVLAELSNADGSLNRGWSAYLTVWSVESAKQAIGKTTVDLNGQDLQQLYNNLKSAIGDDKAKFIIVYRQYGPQQQQQSDGTPSAQSAASASASGASGVVSAAAPVQSAQAVQSFSTVEANQGQGSGQGGPGGQGGQPNQQQPVTVQASALQLKFEQQGGTQINSPLDLIGARVQIPGENNGPPQNVDSPFQDNPGAYREMLKLYDALSFGQGRRVAGRVNVNAAPRPVLNGIPHLTAAAIGKIVARREVEPDQTLSDQRHTLWLLIDGVVTLDEMRQLERFITTGGDVFSGQAVGFFDAGPAAARGEFVIDRSGMSPRLRAWRDLTSLGRGFSTARLGVDEPETR